MNFSNFSFFLIKDADLLKESILGGVAWNVPTEEGRKGVNPFSLCKPYKHFRAFFFFWLSFCVFFSFSSFPFNHYSIYFLFQSL